MSSRDLDAIGFEGLEALDKLGPQWSSLVEQGACDPLCNGFAWTRSHAQAFSRDTEVFGWELREGDRTVGIAAFRLEPEDQRKGLRRAQLLADGSFDSDYLDFPCLPGLEGQVGAAILEAFCERSLPAAMAARAVVLGPMRGDSPALAGFLDAAKRRALPFRAHTVPASAAPLGESFDDSLKGLKSRMRSKVRQSLRRSEEADWSWSWCSSSTDLADRQAVLYDLHTRRWQARGESGSYADDRRRAFYDLLLPEALKGGWLRFAQLDDEQGQPIASQLGFRLGATYYQLQEGYEPDLEERRPGFTLRAHAMGALIEEGVRSYDYLGGAAAGKADWGALEQDLKVVGCALPGIRARFTYGTRALIDRLRS